MKRKPWLQDKRWQKELNLFLQRKEKCELDAFFKHGFRYLAETYLPKKLWEAGTHLIIIIIIIIMLPIIL